MSRSGTSRAACGLALACVVLVASATPAASDIRERRPAPVVHEPGPPALPPGMEALLARRRAAATGSNAMFAQLVTKPHEGYQWWVVAFKPRPSAKTS
jgi:hypothetical protein